MKELIIKDFDKSKFVIDAMSNHDKGDIDPYIAGFITEINKSEDIMTLYSCEGHHDGDNAYLFFNVNEKGWDIFWSKVVPTLSWRFCIDKSKEGGGIHKIDWMVSSKSNKYNSGISIHKTLESNLLYSWSEVKEIFWDTIKEEFLKNF